MTNPALLIMDEPTEGLAPIIIEDVLRVMVTLREAGVAILLLEQRVEVALRVADRVMIMTSRGEITFNGLPADFPKHGTEVPAVV
jgi:branched-chain amino acid transport system ATP-binding protein